MASPAERSAEQCLMDRVEQAFRQSALPVHCEAAPLPAELADAPLASSVLRHDLQHEGIVEQMRGGGLLSPRLTMIDFGAGDGGLCRCVACAVGSGGRFLLVDRNRRSSFPAVGVDVQWLCADVASLPAVDLQRAASGECVVVSNHLCGKALDLAVQRAVDAFHTTTPSRLLGVMAATCCHDQCSWDSFLGRPSFVEWGFSAADFELICQWSRMAPRRGKPDHTRDRVVREAQRLGVAPAEAAQLGLHCRRLMDSARLLRLQQHGFDVALVEHVDFRVTADNVMLRALLHGRQAGLVASQH